MLHTQYTDDKTKSLANSVNKQNQSKAIKLGKKKWGRMYSDK
jgi:hypothetical protein